MSTENRLLVVDGSNLLFQMFFGMPARIVNQDGKAIQGVLGFVGALRKILGRTSPTHAAVLFDGPHQNPRTQVNAEYKANRPDYSQIPEDQNPFSQLPDVCAALDYLQIPHAETETCETDDWVAGYALTYGGEMDVVISSMDSDFFQLVTDHVSVLRYRGEHSVVCTPETIQTKFGIDPSQYADFKSLVGDTADNIRGADRVGPKTAAQLLRRFGTLENLLDHTEEIGKPAVRASILRDGERLRQNYQIICLGNTAPLPFSLDQLTYSFADWKTADVLQGIGLY